MELRVAKYEQLTDNDKPRVMTQVGVHACAHVEIIKRLSKEFVMRLVEYEAGAVDPNPSACGVESLQRCVLVEGVVELLAGVLTVSRSCNRI